jgi:hypothetical protein
LRQQLTPGPGHGDADWDQRYQEMVAKAREHGWIDAERQAIRAHIERML